MATGFIAAAARGAGNTRRQTHTPARRRSPRRHHRRPGALVAALAGLALTVVAAAQTPKPAPPTRIYAPPSQCYAFQSRSDIYLSCGTKVERVTYRGDVGQFAISGDSRVFAFAAGWSRPAVAKLMVRNFGIHGLPRGAAWPWHPYDDFALTASCGTVVYLDDNLWERDASTWTELATWATKEKTAWHVLCSDDGRTSVWRTRGSGPFWYGAQGGPPVQVKAGGYAISPSGRKIAFIGNAALAPCVLHPGAAAPACLSDTSHAARPGRAGTAEISTYFPTKTSVNDGGGVLFGASWFGDDAPGCYGRGELVATRPRPGYEPFDAPCPAILYWKPGMPMAEILHPEMVPQYAQWVSPAAARRLRAWAARHRPKPKRKPR